MGWPLKIFNLFFSILIFFLISADVNALEFKTKKIKLGKKVIVVEIADTEAKRTQGLMDRPKLKKNHGMLFIFPGEQRRSFWMKNTFIALDIAYFDKKKTLLEVHQAEPVKSVMQQEVPKYPSKNKAQYVLEMNQGWFGKNKIRVGTKFSY